MNLKIQEEEVWGDDIALMSNEEIANLSHIYKIRRDLLRAEIDKRFVLLFPEIPEDQITGISLVAKCIILIKLGDKK